MGQSTNSKEGDVLDLVLRAKEGEVEALRDLLDHPVVKSRALAICQRMIWKSPRAGYYRDAEDLRQELFTSFWQNIDKFRCEYGEGSFWRFVEVLAHNIHLSQVRKATREIEQTDETSLDDLPLASPANQYYQASIQTVLDSLNEREMFVLKGKLEGKGVVQIAAEAPWEMTKSTVHRILVGIQKKLVAGVDGCQDANRAKRHREKPPAVDEPE